MTQTQFAKMLGISRNYVYMLENGVKPLTDNMRQRIEECEQRVCSPNRETPSAPPDPGGGLVREDSCHYPGTLPAAVAAMEARLAAMEADMHTMTAQMKTITGLLSGALRDGIEKRKAG